MKSTKLHESRFTVIMTIAYKLKGGGNIILPPFLYPEVIAKDIVYSSRFIFVFLCYTL